MLPIRRPRRNSDLRLRFEKQTLLLCLRSDGSSREVSRSVLGLLTLCDGTLTIDQLADRVEWQGVSRPGRIRLAQHLVDQLAAQDLVREASEAEECPQLSEYFQVYGEAAIHRSFVMDRVRTEAYRRAVFELVRLGDTVIDVGTGTGILAVFAAQAGAAVVHAVEPSPIVHAARRVAKANGCDQIVFHPEDGMLLDLEVKADVILSDWVGHFVVMERIFPAVARLRDLCLAPNGKMFPFRVLLYLAPVCDPAVRSAGAEFWRERPYGIDFSSVHELEYEQGLNSRARMTDPSTLLANPQLVRSFECRTLRPEELAFSKEIEFKFEHDGFLDGFCGHFVSCLSPSVGLDTGPEAPETFFRQQFFPTRPISVRAGEHLRLLVRVTHSAFGCPPITLQGTLSGEKPEREFSFTYNTSR